jgi:hypothetical protein
MTWSAESVATMCEMLQQGRSGTDIAKALGVGRGAVLGKAARLEREGDPRLPANRPKRGAKTAKAPEALEAPAPLPVKTTAENMDALADLLADGVKSVSEAARRLGMTQSRADQLWQRIRRALGPQAV